MKPLPLLIAPAGSFESLAAAAQANAGAVYFGVEQLNMRVRSSQNFSLEEMPEIVARCRSAGMKAFLALNTLVYDYDLQLSERIIREAKRCGVDAVIASDPACFVQAAEAGMPCHASTQCNISNLTAVEFWSRYAGVMVLARELSLEQVKKLNEEITRKGIKGPSGEPVRLEIFIHGALCMAISGKCYLSLHTDLASANRGACVQNCRRSYIVRDKEDGHEFELENDYIMSAKDLCTIRFLDRILDTGAGLLKIEGRGRSADYVFTVTKCYREALDSIREGTFHEEKVAEWERRLGEVFNRGFWEGYYLGRKTGEWSDNYGSAATVRKTYIGKGIKYFEKAGAGEFLLESGELKEGDRLMVMGPTTGILEFTASLPRVNDEPRQKAVKGERVSLAVPAKVRASDKLYLLTSLA